MAKVNLRIPLKLKLYLFLSKFFKKKNNISFSIDEPKKIRDGEDLPIDSLKEYLNSHNFNTKHLSVEQFPSGYSNLTYLLKTDRKEYVLRRPPFGADSLRWT